eukprot:comp81515_c0_seq1/m.48362 comp81515_c0_seq1/g.48362  ORF comp81515_c0_seq1/g.48362 comp81515_c0_seq1/m.48362 type:complete len:307 (-) comp81515_c0_seq1:629-1549(-)
MGVTKMYRALMCAIRDGQSDKTQDIHAKNFLRRSQSAAPARHDAHSDRTAHACAFCAEHIDYFAESKCEAYGTVVIHALPAEGDIDFTSKPSKSSDGGEQKTFLSLSPASRRRSRALSLARTLSGSKKRAGEFSRCSGEERLQHAIRDSLHRRASDAENNPEEYATTAFAVRNGKIHIKCMQECSHCKTNGLSFLDEKSTNTTATTAPQTPHNPILGHGHLTFREECVTVRRVRLDVGGSSYEIRCRPHTRLGGLMGHTMGSERTIVMLLTVDFTPDVLDNLQLTSWLDAKACGGPHIAKRNSAFV